MKKYKIKLNQHKGLFRTNEMPLKEQKELFKKQGTSLIKSVGLTYIKSESLFGMFSRFNRGRNNKDEKTIKLIEQAFYENIDTYSVFPERSPADDIEVITHAKRLLCNKYYYGFGRFMKSLSNSRIGFRSANRYVRRYGIGNRVSQKYTRIYLKGDIDRSGEKILDSEVGGVYILESKFGYKIGKAKRFSRRLSDFNTMLPFDFEPIRLYQIESESESFKMETKLHKMYKHKHIKGEWFSISKDDLVEIDNLYKVEQEKYCKS